MHTHPGFSIPSFQAHLVTVLLLPLAYPIITYSSPFPLHILLHLPTRHRHPARRFLNTTRGVTVRHRRRDAPSTACDSVQPEAGERLTTRGALNCFSTFRRCFLHPLDDFPVSLVLSPTVSDQLSPTYRTVNFTVN